MNRIASIRWLFFLESLRTADISGIPHSHDEIAGKQASTTQSNNKEL